MLVVYVQGDVFLPDLRPAMWNPGEEIDCEIASRTSTSIDKRGDLLLCGAQTQLAWSQGWLRADISRKSTAMQPSVLSSSMAQATDRGGLNLRCGHAKKRPQALLANDIFWSKIYTFG
jgi:hypothetical protein